MFSELFRRRSCSLALRVSVHHFVLMVGVFRDKLAVPEAWNRLGNTDSGLPRATNSLPGHPCPCESPSSPPPNPLERRKSL